MQKIHLLIIKNKPLLDVLEELKFFYTYNLYLTYVQYNIMFTPYIASEVHYIASFEILTIWIRKVFMYFDSISSRFKEEIPHLKW